MRETSLFNEPYSLMKRINWMWPVGYGSVFFPQIILCYSNLLYGYKYNSVSWNVWILKKTHEIHQIHPE